MALNDIKVPKENAQGTFDEIALAASDLKLGTTSGLPLKTGTNGVVEAGAFGSGAGSFCAGDDPRLSDARTPSSHAASHAAGTKASYSGQVGGMSTSVTIRANNVGTGGNSITLSFNGTDDIDTVISAWNSANPSNQATLHAGYGDQIPSNGQTITLSGGIAAGSDPLKNINQNLGTEDSVQFNTIGVGDAPTGSLRKFHQHGGKFTVESSNSSYGQFQVINPSADEVTFVLASDATAEENGEISAANPENIWAFGIGPYGLGATNFVISSNNQGAAAPLFIEGSSGNVAIGYNAPTTKLDVNGDLALTDTDSNFKATFDPFEQLSNNRTYGLPDRSGELMLVGDAPASHTHVVGDVTGAAASGSITSSGLTQATARLLGRTTASTGAVEEISVGAGLSLSAGELSATGSGVTAVGASTADVFSVSGSNLVADDGGTIDSANPFVQWNDTSGKLVYANPLSRPSGAFYVGLAPTTTALGSNSVNIQAERNAATQVASGSDAVAIGNRTTAANTSVAIGYNVNAAASSVVIGSFTTSTFGQHVCIGYQARMTAFNGVSIGFESNASASNSIAIGVQSAASGTNATAITNSSATASLRAQFLTNNFSSVYWGGQTTNNTATILNLDATATNRFTIAANTALAVDILLVARRSDVADKWLVARRFLGIRRDGSNNTSLIGTVQTLGTDQSAGSPTWSFTLTADDTNEALQLEVTGAASETVQWRACAIYRVV